MASACDFEPAYVCLGYIWYYGRSGEKDYKKAFENYSKAAERGNITAKYKIADMYKNGYYVDKDHDRYCEIIESLYPEVKEARFLNEPLPEIFMRLSRIRREQGRTDEAVRLLFEARPFLTRRIMHDPFFGDLTNMEWLIKDLYELIDCDMNDLRFYDLYYVLRTPRAVTFRYRGKVYTAESAELDGGIAVRFGGKWYRSIKSFFAGAEADGVRLTAVPYKLYDFRVRTASEN